LAWSGVSTTWCGSLFRRRARRRPKTRLRIRPLRRNAPGTGPNRVAQASRSGRYVRFLGLAGAIVLALGAVGFLPTRRLAGQEALAAMAAGCVISFLAAASAAWLLVVVGAATPEARMQRAFLAMVARLAIAIILAVAAALSGEFARMPLLFWVATTYVVLLPLEVRLAIAPE
jgi:hypothetical protein